MLILLPRWKISYSLAGSPQVKSIIVHGGSLISAYKDATRQLWKKGLAVHVLSIAETYEHPVYELADSPLVDTLPSESEPA